MHITIVSGALPQGLLHRLPIARGHGARKTGAVKGNYEAAGPQRSAGIGWGYQRSGPWPISQAVGHCSHGLAMATVQRGCAERVKYSGNECEEY